MAARALLTRKPLATVLRKDAKPIIGAGIAAATNSRWLHVYTLPDLDYDYGALEPAISGEIMQLHHQKHHQTYITNYNKALEQLQDAVAKKDSSAVVKLQGAIKFNGGGHVNHSIFWKNLAPVREGGGEPPKGSLGWAIDTHFGSFEALVQKVNAEGAALQGSGWVWLGLDKELKRLVVETTANQLNYPFHLPLPLLLFHMMPGGYIVSLFWFGLQFCLFVFLLYIVSHHSRSFYSILLL